MKKIAGLLCLVAGISGCASTQTSQHNQTPKNIIMIVADGMGPAFTTGYRLYKDDINTPKVEPTIFDHYKIGMASTYPAPVSGYVTDSAAAATALASGVKSFNKAVGVDVNKQPVQSVLEYAKSIGKKTGLIVTSQVNHATPASYIAHNESRLNYNDIADDYIDEKINNKIKADVILGGGSKYFIRDDRNIVDEFKSAGFQYVDQLDKLNTLETTKPVLGLFAPVGLPYVVDSKQPDRLLQMTKSGLKHLENKQGYFALIEASLVDWAAHDNDIGAAMAEMDDLASTLEYLESYVSKHKDTLVVLTADHSTGGMTIGANRIYAWHPDYIKGMKASVREMAKSIKAAEQLDPVVVENTLGKSLTKDQYSKIVAAKDSELYELMKAISTVFDQGSNTGWTTGGHTGVDVEVFAFGTGSDVFKGQQDNTDIANKIFKFLGRK